MIIEISIAAIAVAFIVLVIYLIVLINSIRVTLQQVDKTIVEVRHQLDEVGIQAKKTIEHTNQVSFDLKRKMESITSVFNAISNVGEILENKTSILKKEAFASSYHENHLADSDSPKIEREFRTHENINVADILELVGLGIRLWNKINHKHLSGAKNKEKEIIQ